MSVIARRLGEERAEGVNGERQEPSLFLSPTHTRTLQISFVAEACLSRRVVCVQNRCKE